MYGNQQDTLAKIQAAQQANVTKVSSLGDLSSVFGVTPDSSVDAEDNSSSLSASTDVSADTGVDINSSFGTGSSNAANNYGVSNLTNDQAAATLSSVSSLAGNASLVEGLLGNTAAATPLGAVSTVFGAPAAIESGNIGKIAASAVSVAGLLGYSNPITTAALLGYKAYNALDNYFSEGNVSAKTALAAQAMEDNSQQGFQAGMTIDANGNVVAAPDTVANTTDISPSVDVTGSVAPDATTTTTTPAADPTDTNVSYTSPTVDVSGPSEDGPDEDGNGTESHDDSGPDSNGNGSTSHDTEGGGGSEGGGDD